MIRLIIGLPRASNRPALQAGFGLVEIMVAMTIGLFMLGGVLSLVLWTSKARTELDKTSEQIENGRYALQLLRDEIRSASFYGASQVIAGAHTTPSLCPSEPVALSALGFAYDTSASSATLPVGIQGYPDVDAATATCLNDVIDGTEALTIRSVHTTPASAAPVPTGWDSLVNGAAYMQLSQCQTDTQPMIFGIQGGTTFNLHGKNCTAGAGLWRYLSRTYYLSDCDLCDVDDGIPTLKVAELVVDGGDLVVRASSVVEGIEDIHFEYGMDLTNDGAPDCYVPDPTLDTKPTVCTPSGWVADDAINWANVVSVRINLLARSIQPSSEWDDGKTYDLGRLDGSGDRVLEGPFNDHYKRQVYSTVVTLPNVSGVREW